MSKRAPSPYAIGSQLAKRKALRPVFSQNNNVFVSWSSMANQGSFAAWLAAARQPCWRTG